MWLNCPNIYKYFSAPLCLERKSILNYLLYVKVICRASLAVPCAGIWFQGIAKENLRFLFMNAGSRLAGKSHRTSQALAKERNEVLKAGLESLIHNQKLREAEAQKPNKTTSAINPDHVKVFLLLLIYLC